MKRRSAVPFPAGTGSASVSILPTALLNLSERRRYPLSSDRLGKPTWAGMVHPGPSGLRSTDGSGVILPTTPLPRKCQPTFLSLFAIRNFHYYYHRYFPTLLSFAALATVQRVQKGLAEHRGESVSLLQHSFFLKCNARVQYFTQHYSGAAQSATPSLQSSPSSFCKPFLPGGPLPQILEILEARILHPNIRSRAAPRAWQLSGMLKKEIEAAALVQKRWTLTAKSVTRELPFKSCIPVNLKQNSYFLNR